MEVPSLQKLRVDTHTARKYSCFHHFKRDGQRTMKYLCAIFVFKYTEESIFTSFVLRILHSCYQESGICMQ